MGRALTKHTVRRIGRLTRNNRIVNMAGTEIARTLPHVKASTVNGRDGTPGAHYGYFWKTKTIYTGSIKYE